jgi:hypothetical protein
MIRGFLLGWNIKDNVQEMKFKKIQHPLNSVLSFIAYQIFKDSP